MKCLKLKNQFTLAVLAAISFTACKKNDIIQPDAAAAPVDSASVEALRVRNTATATNTFYISPAGNDATGTGTGASPWKTLYKATSTVSTTGAIIHVNAGTYVETATCALKPGVSIEGDGAASVLKNTLTGDWTALLALMSSAEGTNGNQHISKVKLDGQNTSSFWGITVMGRSNVSIHDITVVNFKEAGVVLQGRVDNALAAPSLYAKGNTFYNNTLTNCSGFAGYGRGCLTFGGQEGMLIYNNVITQNQRAAGNNGYCVKYVNDGFTKGCKIYGNTFTRSQATGYDFDFCLELWNNSGMEVYNNVLNGGAIDLNIQTKGAYTYSVWVHNNQFLQPVANLSANQAGVILEYGTESALIENNVFSKQNFGISFTPREGSVIKDVVIRKNLMTGIAGGVWGGYYITFGSDGNNCTVDNIDVYNNTMEYDRSHRFWIGINLPASSTTGSFSNIRIKNNIISGAGSTVIGQGGAARISNLAIQYNDLYDNTNNNTPVFSNAPTGYLFSNNINTIPTFGSNYTLPVGSLLINAGINVGLHFNGAAPDMGYVEN